MSQATLPSLTLACLLASSSLAGSAQAEGGGGANPPPALGWTSVTVTGTGLDRGKFASMAWGQGFCAPLGFPCQIIGIAFHEVDTGDLLYASSTGGPFSVVRVHRNVDAGSIVGTHTSLAFDGVTPVIAYHRDDFSSLMIARRVGGTSGNCGPSGDWDCRSIEGGGFSSSMTIDALGRMHVAHISNTSNLRILRFATPASTTIQWQKTVESGVANVRLAVDELNQPHAIWATQTAIKYSRNLFEPADKVTLETFTPLVGHGPARVAIAANNSHRAHVAFATPVAGNYNVTYMYQTGDTTWAPRDTVGIILGSTAQAPGLSLLLDEDNEDLRAIAWGYAGSTGGVAYKRMKIAYPGAHLGLYWNSETVDYVGGHFSSLIRLFNDKLAIAHYDSSAQDLRYSVEQ